MVNNDKFVNMNENNTYDFWRKRNNQQLVMSSSHMFGHFAFPKRHQVTQNHRLSNKTKQN